MGKLLPDIRPYQVDALIEAIDEIQCHYGHMGLAGEEVRFSPSDRSPAEHHDLDASHVHEQGKHDHPLRSWLGRPRRNWNACTTIIPNAGAPLPVGVRRPSKLILPKSQNA